MSIRYRSSGTSALTAAILLSLTLAGAGSALSQEIKNPAEAPSGVETVELEELWRVGGWDEDVLFGVITSIITDDSGNFYMLDSQLNEVQVYSPDGDYLNTIGREGEGPGEFRGAFNLLLLPSGNIGVLQAFPSKIVGLTPDGNPADGFELPKNESDAGFKALIQAQHAGDNLAVIYTLNQPGEGGFTQRSVLAMLDEAAENERVLHTQDSTMNAADPLIAERDWDAFRNRWTAGPDGQVYSAVDFGEYKVNVWGPDGKLRHVISRDYPVHERTQQQSDTVLDIYKGFTRQIPIPNMRFDIESNWNPIQQITARDDGTLWVQTSRGSWDVPDGALGGFDVYDSDGKLARQVILKGQGNPQTDGYFFVGDRLFVVTDWLDSMMALQGGGGAAEEADEDAEPMEVICYRLK